MAYAVMPTGFKGTEDPGVTAPGFSVVRVKEKKFCYNRKCIFPVDFFAQK